MTNQIILIIEDNSITRKMLRITLQAEKYTVLEAEDGKTALQLMKDHNPDLILQDMMLPDMGGVELNYKLRALPNGVNIPIIALSGFLNKMEEFQASDTGLTAFLLKPIEPSRLVDVIKSYLPLAPVPQAKISRGQRVLIADDNATQLKLLKLQLMHAGFEVIAACDGIEALAQIKNNPLDAVISDVLMPNMDGFELCFEIRNDPAHSHLPVILITSHYLEESDRALGEKVAANYYLTRTPDAKELIATLDKCLQSKTPIKKSESVKNFKEEHTYRLVRQLERQVTTNAGLAQRYALQSAQLALLGGIADAITNSIGIENTLRDVLSTCLDAAGISKGALYLFDKNEVLEIRELVGYIQDDKTKLQNMFGFPELLKKLFTTKEIIQIPSSDLPEDKIKALLENANVSTMVLIPLVFEKHCIGALLLGSKTTDVNAVDPLNFARTLGTQLSQAVALAFAFENVVASDRRSKALMDNASCGIFIINRDGIFLETNKQGEKLLDCPKEKMLGKSFREFMFEADLNTANSVFQEALQQGLILTREIRIKTDSGEIRTSEYSIVKMETEKEPLLIVVANDVTERDQLRAQTLLNDKLAMVGRLSAGVAHEINNPVAWISSNLNFIQTTINELRDQVDFKFKQNLEKISEALSDSIQGAHRIHEIVSELRNFAHADHNEMKPTDIHDILNSVIKVATPNFKSPIMIEKNFSDHLPNIMAIAGKLNQVFLNLMMNAAQAMDKSDSEKNKIIITTTIEGDALRVDIADTGIGISDENLHHIFTPFFTTKPIGEGTGLGLSICHEIMRSMGGKITVKSVVNKGSVFSVYLPIQPLPKDEIKQGEQKSVIIQRKRILIVDDEDYLLKSLKRLLENEHDITIALSGAEAMKRLAQNGTAYDVILLDLMMPEMSGADLYFQIKEKNPHLLKSIIFMSGGVYHESLSDFLSKVDNQCLEKPFKKEALFSAIEKL